MCFWVHGFCCLPWILAFMGLPIHPCFQTSVFRIVVFIMNMPLFENYLHFEQYSNPHSRTFSKAEADNDSITIRCQRDQNSKGTREQERVKPREPQQQKTGMPNDSRGGNKRTNKLAKLRHMFGICVLRRNAEMKYIENHKHKIIINCNHR